MYLEGDPKWWKGRSKFSPILLKLFHEISLKWAWFILRSISQLNSFLSIKFHFDSFDSDSVCNVRQCRETITDMSVKLAQENYMKICFYLDISRSGSLNFDISTFIAPDFGISTLNSSASALTVQLNFDSKFFVLANFGPSGFIDGQFTFVYEMLRKDILFDTRMKIPRVSLLSFRTFVQNSRAIFNGLFKIIKVFTVSIARI